MNLKRWLILGSAASIVMMCVVAALSYALLRAMEFSVLSVTEEYTEIQEIDEVRTAFADARAALTAIEPRRADAIEALDRADGVIESFVESQDAHLGADDLHHAEEAEVGLRIRDQINDLRPRLAASRGPDGIEPAAAIAAIDRLRAELNILASGANELVEESLAATHRQLAFATTALVACCAIGAILVVILAWCQHRWVVMPIVSLRAKVRAAVRKRTPAAGHDTTDVLGELDSSFDGLLRDLEGLYDSLDDRIRTKSRELVRSERLASVGYLAAGVAHEVNNPLNSILGYTELTLRDLTSANGSPPAQAIESLTVVRDETMRCKHIVEKLLSLVRKSDAPREKVDLIKVIRDVVTMVDGLKQFRGRTISAELPDDETLPVLAREAELKQVMVNLIVNALEATSPGDGRVVIAADHDGDGGRVRVQVRDNGQGMTTAAIGRVFEPFFTEKRRGSSESGTGLGLSIVHAIIGDHGGTITASSDGPAKGSVFTVSLPAWKACTNDES